MGTSTNYLLKGFISLIFSFAFIQFTFASNSLAIDSCDAYIVVEYDSINNTAVLSIEHSGTPNSTVYWFDSSSTNHVTVVESGEYCATVTTETGCTVSTCITVQLSTSASCQSYIVKEPLSEGGFLLIVETENGDSNTSYQWSTGSAEASIHASESGDYCVYITTGTGCYSEACIYIEVDPLPVDTCHTWIEKIPQEDGTVKLWAHSEGIGPFSYAWHSTTSDIANGEEYIYVDESGDYCVLVYDANQCASEACVSVDVPNTPDSCYFDIQVFIIDAQTADGSVAIGVDPAGVGPFQSFWSNGSAGLDTHVQETGEYCVTVYDANGCTGEGCIYVEVPPVPVDTCHTWLEQLPQDDGTVKVWAHTGGVAPYTYAWNNEASGTVGEPYIYVDISGEYCITVYDANQCVSEACIYVEVPNPNDTCYIDPILHIIQDPTTAHVRLGVDPTGEGPFTIYWPNGAAGDVFDVVESGEYCVTVIDANGCIGEACKYVEVDPVPTDSCYTWLEQLPQDDGTVKIWAHAEGVAPYTYVWNDDATTGTVGEPYIYVDVKGEYCVTVYDANQCASEVCVYVEVDPVPTDSCYTWVEQLPQDDGSVKVWAHTSGEGPFTFVWTNDAAGTVGEPYQYVRETGEYCVIVYDAYQCTSEACVYVEVDPVPNDSCEIDLVIFTDDDNSANGYKKLGVDPAGVAPFTYLWSDGSVNADFYAQEEGQYCVTVIDANGCVGTACIYVELPVDPIDSCLVYLHSEAFAADYVVEVRAEATGVGPFEYMWSNGSIGSAIEVFEDQEVCVIVIDATGCESKSCIDVDVPERPCSLEIIRTNNSTDEVVVLKALVETNSDVEFHWSNGSTDDVIRVTTTGEYCVRIETSNGCVKEACVYVEIDNIICETFIEFGPNTTDYAAVLEANTAGVGPFVYSWSNGSDDSYIIAEESGEYCVEVEDARGCVSEACIIVELAVPTCESMIYIVDESEEAVVLSVETDGHGPFEYFWSNGEHSKEIKVSESKEYCVEVFDALGCLSWHCLYVEVENYQNCEVEIEVISNPDSTEYKVIAHPSGVAPFTYQWAHGDTSRYFYPELDGYFCVTVTDAEGCVSETCFKTEGITPSVELEAFPSPTTGDFHIVIDSELEFEGLVEIRDINGHLLFTKKIDVALGIQALDFSSEEYPKGVFFVNIIRGSHVESIRVVKMGD